MAGDSQAKEDVEIWVLMAVRNSHVLQAGRAKAQMVKLASDQKMQALDAQVAEMKDARTARASQIRMAGLACAH